MGFAPLKETTSIRPSGEISTRSGAGSSLNSYPSSCMLTKGSPSPTQYSVPVRSKVPTCAAACSDYSHAARVAARLNARFFNASGVGLEQGLLIHGLDHQTSGTKNQW